eukprot:gnl/Chilomastix_cuspidata/3399.p1 GENE.gnl/Chilomastix_cuspidata/3399~~gnl/Chilomastix_cuspidata/3399.p1  ORF type:complete len:1331 (-),score=565.12 gnl/Chilomastix_cuspidata/3399:179-3940(-)
MPDFESSTSPPQEKFFSRVSDQFGETADGYPFLVSHPQQLPVPNGRMPLPPEAFLNHFVTVRLYGLHVQAARKRSKSKGKAVEGAAEMEIDSVQIDLIGHTRVSLARFILDFESDEDAAHRFPYELTRAVPIIPARQAPAKGGSKSSRGQPPSGRPGTAPVAQTPFKGELRLRVSLSRPLPHGLVVKFHARGLFGANFLGTAAHAGPLLPFSYLRYTLQLTFPGVTSRALKMFEGFNAFTPSKRGERPLSVAQASAVPPAGAELEPDDAQLPGEDFEEHSDCEAEDALSAFKAQIASISASAPFDSLPLIEASTRVSEAASAPFVAFPRLVPEKKKLQRRPASSRSAASTKSRPPEEDVRQLFVEYFSKSCVKSYAAAAAGGGAECVLGVTCKVAPFTHPPALCRNSPSYIWLTAQQAEKLADQIGQKNMEKLGPDELERVPTPYKRGRTPIIPGRETPRAPSRFAVRENSDDEAAWYDMPSSQAESTAHESSRTPSPEPDASGDGILSIADTSESYLAQCTVSLDPASVDAFTASNPHSKLLEPYGISDVLASTLRRLTTGKFSIPLRHLGKPGVVAVGSPSMPLRRPVDFKLQLKENTQSRAPSASDGKGRKGRAAKASAAKTSAEPIFTPIPYVNCRLATAQAVTRLGRFYLTQDMDTTLRIVHRAQERLKAIERRRAVESEMIVALRNSEQSILDEVRDISAMHPELPIDYIESLSALYMRRAVPFLRGNSDFSVVAAATERSLMESESFFAEEEHTDNDDQEVSYTPGRRVFSPAFMCEHSLGVGGRDALKRGMELLFREEKPAATSAFCRCLVKSGMIDEAVASAVDAIDALVTLNAEDVLLVASAAKVRAASPIEVKKLLNEVLALRASDNARKDDAWCAHAAETLLGNAPHPLAQLKLADILASAGVYAPELLPHEDSLLPSNPHNPPTPTLSARGSARTRRAVPPVRAPDRRVQLSILRAFLVVGRLVEERTPSGVSGAVSDTFLALMKQDIPLYSSLPEFWLAFGRAKLLVGDAKAALQMCMECLRLQRGVPVFAEGWALSTVPTDPLFVENIAHMVLRAFPLPSQGSSFSEEGSDQDETLTTRSTMFDEPPRATQRPSIGMLKQGISLGSSKALDLGLPPAPAASEAATKVLDFLAQQARTRLVTHPSYHVLVGWAHLLNEDCVRARAALALASQLDPTNPAPFGLLCWICSQVLDSPDEAIEFARYAVLKGVSAEWVPAEAAELCHAMFEDLYCYRDDAPE